MLLLIIATLYRRETSSSDFGVPRPRLILGASRLFYRL